MRESELVILLTGAKFRSEAEFDIHVGEARRAGVGLDVILSIPRGVLLSAKERKKEGQDEKDGAGRRAEFSLENVKKCMIPLLEKEHASLGSATDNESGGTHPSKERELAIVLFTAELLDTCTVSDETYEYTKRALGGQDSVLVEINAIVGYYSYVAFTLNVFKIPSSASPTK